jgi:phosphate transport system substrate-binding protein
VVDDHPAKSRERTEETYMRSLKRIYSRVALPAIAGLLLVALAVALSACGSKSSGSTGPAADTIVGAGSTFAEPLYSKWASDYQGVAGVKLNYQAVGSSAGIAAIEAKTVDFGATDAPLSAADLQSNGLVQFPTMIGGAVPVLNVSGIAPGELKLDGPTLADIFLGKITTWNDPAIAKLNPGMTLPSTAINVVHRSDGSGTSWMFTSYLSAVSPAWQSQVGANTTPSWPVGTGAKGSSGVAALVQQIDGSIGYVEYTYAQQNGMNTAQMKNADGMFVKPSLSAFAAAATMASWKPSEGFALPLVNEPGSGSWPITGASYILMQKDQQDAARAGMALKFIDWAYTNGAQTASSLNYVPIPTKVYKLVEKVWEQQITVSGTAVWPQ